MTNKLLYTYKNGNYTTSIFSDGTKYRCNELDSLIPEFPESIDLKITNFCELNCNFCFEQSSLNGIHADILNYLYIFDNLPQGFEIAIGGGNPLSHPNLIEFLEYLLNKGFICSLTVNYKSLKCDNYVTLLNYLIDNDLIKGVGISCNNDIEIFSLLQKINKRDNIVIHVINGIVNLSFILELFKYKYKVLILGYKKYGKGIEFFNKGIDLIERNMEILSNIISTLVLLNRISFDNLALLQLDIKKRLKSEIWDTLYMGDDGIYTLYIDLVDKKYGISSTAIKNSLVNNTIINCFNNLSI